MQSLPPRSIWPAVLTGNRLRALILLGAMLIPLYGIWLWFFCRIEVDSGQAAVLIAKTGTNLPSGQIVATAPGQKGIQLAPLPEGRYFRNPFFWDWKYTAVVDIPAGKLGVQIRQYGRDPTQEDLQRGQVLAGTEQKGILPEVLMPGRHRLNPYAYQLELHPAIHIDPGFVGVVTNMVGAEPKVKNRFLVDKGERGVQREILLSGTYYLNPYVTRVDLVDTRSQRYDLAGAEALKFPSTDGFEITVLVTVEWSIDPMRAAEVFVRIGELSARPTDIEGSKHGAKDFLLGQAREQFQDSFRAELLRIGKQKNLNILSAFIRHIIIPDTLLAPIKESFVAVEKEKTAKVWEETRRSGAALERERTLIEQRRREVQAETAALVATVVAQTEQEMANIEAHTRLRVAERQQQIAALEAERTRTLGTARAEVIALHGNAVAGGFDQKVTAFQGDAASLARYNFARHLADNFTVRIIHAGPGTLWTDLKGTAGISDLSGLKILQQDTPASK